MRSLVIPLGFALIIIFGSILRNWHDGPCAHDCGHGYGVDDWYDSSARPD